MKKTILLCIIAIACALTAFTANKDLTLDEVFGKVSEIERFEVLDFPGGDMGFMKVSKPRVSTSVAPLPNSRL